MLLWLMQGLVKSVGLVVGLTWAWKELSMGICHSKKKLKGKTVIVTGGNGGIGFETAKDMAARDARVILACRSKERGMAAVKKIIAATGNQEVELMLLDLSSFSSVKAFAREVTDTVDKVDILVNNAGIGPQVGDKLSQDGYDNVLQTNHFSHFLLTNLLKDALMRAPSPRIVIVSSGAAKQTKPPEHIDYDLIKKGSEYEVDLTYAVSKFMNILHTQELVRRWGNEGIKAYSLHPGVVRTEIFSNIESPPFYKKLSAPVQAMIRGFLMGLAIIYGKTPEQGAQTSIYCCVEDGLVNGEFYSDCRLAPWYFRHTEMKNARMADDLWNFSLKLTGQ